jgi:hypothetical protein
MEVGLGAMDPHSVAFDKHLNPTLAPTGNYSTVLLKCFFSLGYFV